MKYLPANSYPQLPSWMPAEILPLGGAILSDEEAVGRSLHCVDLAVKDIGQILASHFRD